jgi:hypothetical protein
MDDVSYHSHNSKVREGSVVSLLQNRGTVNTVLGFTDTTDVADGFSDLFFF